MSFAGHAYFDHDYVFLPEGVGNVDKQVRTGFLLEHDHFLGRVRGHVSSETWVCEDKIKRDS